MLYFIYSVYQPYEVDSGFHMLQIGMWNSERLSHGLNHPVRWWQGVKASRLWTPGLFVSGDPWKSQPVGRQLAGSRGRRLPGVTGLENADPGRPSASFYLHLRSDQPTRYDPRVTSHDFLITWWWQLDKNASPRNYQRVIFINGVKYQNGIVFKFESLFSPLSFPG